MPSLSLNRLILAGAAMAAMASGNADPIHDRENLPEARSLMTPQTVVGHLPKRIDGSPDWVKALDLNMISPRSTLKGAQRAPDGPVDMPQDGIVFTHTLFMPHVVFPHRQHAEWLTCMNCHEFLFDMKATGRGQGMTSIFQGRHCGFCHGRVAFSPIGSCYRCHSKPNPDAQRENSPFVEPKAVESLPVEVQKKKPRRGSRESTWTAGRLMPSIVKPPAEPSEAIEKPELN